MDCRNIFLKVVIQNNGKRNNFAIVDIVLVYKIHL